MPAPGPGWGFVVVLTSQDGFSPDNARSFTPTTQEFQFGVCATASADPRARSTSASFQRRST
jgi:carbohydrate-binding DOMON domain-containing protein